MAQFYVTAFSPQGEALLNETFDAQNDEEAQNIGQKRLEEADLLQYTSRVTSSDGRLVHFHR